METVALSTATLLYGGVVGFIAGIVTTLAGLSVVKTYTSIQERRNKLFGRK